MTKNEMAFLGMIKSSELPPGILAVSDNGYNVIVGSTAQNPILFPALADGTPDYADHPRREIYLDKLGEYSSAAGAFQIKESIFDAYKTRLDLPDFSPDSQNRIAMQLIIECRARDDINAGRIIDAIMKCSSRWASFPGASYGQHTQTFGLLKTAFRAAGGTIAEA